MEIYLDNAATTRAYESVCQIMVKTMRQDYGNPSALHMKGVEAEHYVKNARQYIARTLKIGEKELIFTSGGTESNNMAIIGGAMVNIDIAAISGADAFAKTAKDGVTECIRLKKLFNEKRQDKSNE